MISYFIIVFTVSIQIFHNEINFIVTQFLILFTPATIMKIFLSWIVWKPNHVTDAWHTRGSDRNIRDSTQTTHTITILCVLDEILPFSVLTSLFSSSMYSSKSKIHGTSPSLSSTHSSFLSKLYVLTGSNISPLKSKCSIRSLSWLYCMIQIYYFTLTTILQTCCYTKYGNHVTYIHCCL